MNDQDPTPGRAGAAVGAEEIETTTSEKLLAVVLAVFIAIGAVWAYERLDHIDRPSPVYAHRAVVAAQDRVAIARHTQAARAKQQALTRQFRAENALELHREAYRTALDAGEPAGKLRERYGAAQAELARASAELRKAKGAEEATAPAAAAVQRRIGQARSATTERYEDERRSHDRLVFVLRLALLVILLAASYRLLGSLRARHSRYLPTALALIIATTVLALVMAADYSGDYIEFEEVGPLAISLAGIALTLAAFIALQRYLRRRVPLRRVRRGDCPFCGYPVRAGRHCEGCGRRVLAECSTCQQPRRVGTPRCGACGSA
jgi:hypothetical protein